MRTLDDLLEARNEAVLLFNLEHSDSRSTRVCYANVYVKYEYSQMMVVQAPCSCFREAEPNLLLLMWHRALLLQPTSEPLHKAVGS